MDSHDHYLKDELYRLMRSDPSIFEFLEKGSLDGIWYWDLEKPENEWMSPQFWMTLGFDPEEKKHLAAEWQDLIHPDDLQIASITSKSTVPILTILMTRLSAIGTRTDRPYGCGVVESSSGTRTGNPSACSALTMT